MLKDEIEALMGLIYIGFDTGFNYNLCNNMKKIMDRITGLIKEEKNGEHHKDHGVILHEDR